MDGSARGDFISSRLGGHSISAQNFQYHNNKSAEGHLKVNSLRIHSQTSNDNTSNFMLQNESSLPQIVAPTKGVIMKSQLAMRQGSKGRGIKKHKTPTGKILIGLVPSAQPWIIENQN